MLETADRPDWQAEIRQQLAGLRLDPTRELEIVEELLLHVEDRYAELVSGGVTAWEARRTVLAELKQSETLTRELRRIERRVTTEPIVLGANRRSVMEDLWQDLRFGIRLLLKKPGFTAVAIISLALGMGANTAIFSVANALLLRPLPYQNPDRLVILWNRSPGIDIAKDWLSPPEYLDVKNQSHVFDQLAISIGGSVNLTGQGAPERLEMVSTSSSLFSLLGAQALNGRVFLPDEDAPGKPKTVIVSYGLWQRRFGSDPNLVGKTLTLNAVNFTVVGIMPSGFAINKEMMPTVGGVEKADLFLPLPLSQAQLRNRGNQNFNVVGRLKPGVTPAQAQSDVNVIVARMKQDYPEMYTPNSGYMISVVPLLEEVVGNIRLALLILLGSVGLVLLIACANVANLLLARASSRQREIAVRTAIGASRQRLIRQLLTESMLLALAGGALGMIIAWWGIRILRLISPGNVPRLGEVGIDGRVLAFTFAISLATGLIFGLAPALKASRVDLNESLKDGGRIGGSAAGHRLRSSLVVVELALSLALLIGAGLLTRSFLSLQKVDPGFNPQNVISLRLALNGPKYADDKVRATFFQHIWDRVATLPGVKSAGGVSVVPMGQSVGWGGITVEGYVPPPGDELINADQRVASPDYFRTMEIPLLKGRFFNEHDTNTSALVVIIDSSLAERFWPHGDPIGKRLKPGEANSTTPWFTIVGVVGHVKQYALDSESRMALYYAHSQNPSGGMYLVASTGSDPAQTVSAITNEIRTQDADLPVFDIETMEQRLSASVAQRRFSMLLLGIFASVALVLAAIGIYGVMSYSVTQSTRDMGIRMALGAQKRDVIRQIVGEGIILALLGTTAGLIVAYAFTRMMASLLFGVSSTDALTFGLIPVVLIAVALLSSYIPARRAARIDPMVALRYE